MDNDDGNNDEEESEEDVDFIETRDEVMGKCVNFVSSQIIFKHLSVQFILL